MAFSCRYYKLSFFEDTLEKCHNLGNFPAFSDTLVHVHRKNVGATAFRAWPRAETFNGLKKVQQILYIPEPTTL